MSDLLKLSLIELNETIQSRKASPVELMEAVLKRIDETNPKINSVVAMYDRETLMKNAAESEERIARNDAAPLEGIPLGVQDLEDAEGLPTSMGSVPFKDNIADSDSTQVERLKDSGAITVGKTNTPEFGDSAITKNLLYGTTRSPWNQDVTPGGASGGSAAALAGKVLPLVTASDTGGSVRISASFVGAFGMKPTFGRIPTGPVMRWAYRDTKHYGMITKTVTDAALFLDQVIGRSPTDPNSLQDPGISYFEAVQKPVPQTLKIGFSPDLVYGVVQSDIAAVVEEGVKIFEKLGHKVSPIKIGPPTLGDEWAKLGNFENAAQLSNLIKTREGDFGRSFLARVKTAMTVSADWWGKAAVKRAHLIHWCMDMFDQFDVIITPTVPYDPPSAKGPFPEETEGRKQPSQSVGSFTIPFNLSWHPAATVRAGTSKANLPVGMQIICPRFRDDLLLQVAKAFETECPWHPEWPEF